MKLHRFFVHPEAQHLQSEFWLRDEALFHQWNKVLRFQEKDQVVIFNGENKEILYEIIAKEDGAYKVRQKTELVPQKPKQEIYLFFSVLKKDKNQWVLQKCTELGVSHFVPILAQRSEKTGFNIERAQKIVIEASEQCGRFTIPTVREPILIETALKEYQSKIDTWFYAEQSEDKQMNDLGDEKVGIFVGPEGGWSNEEKNFFETQKIQPVHIAQFTLRAETACVVASAKLLQ